MNSNGKGCESMQHAPTGTIRVYPDRVQGTISPLIYGHFVEHFPKCVYGGYYDPQSPLADNHGLRTDVVEAVRHVKPGIMRWPGGNYASAYHWRNGIGEKRARPTTYDPVWMTEDTNQFGTAEFIELCRQTEAEPYICLNLGTGSIDEAMQWVEYCNLDGNTEYATLRRQHGYAKPFNVKYWGLGNEVYGPWQMNTMDATTYGKVAVQYAKAIKWVDPRVKIVAVAGQHADWQEDLLTQTRDPIVVGNSRVAGVDYVSLHAYFASEPMGFYETIAAADHVEEQTQLLRAAIHAVFGSRERQPLIAWDEWNFYFWSHYERASENYRNEVYDLKDALFTASVLNGFIRNCDIVGMANYSPFVNIRGAIHVDGPALLFRPQYHVFDLYANYARGRAVATTIESEAFSVSQRPNVRFLTNARQGKVLDAAATLNSDSKTLFLSIVNRHECDAIPCTVDLGAVHLSSQATLFSINASSPSESNSLNDPDNVTLKRDKITIAPSPFSHTLPAHSITAFLFKME